MLAFWSGGASGRLRAWRTAALPAASEHFTSSFPVLPESLPLPCITAAVPSFLPISSIAPALSPPPPRLHLMSSPDDPGPCPQRPPLDHECSSCPWPGPADDPAIPLVPLQASGPAYLVSQPVPFSVPAFPRPLCCPFALASTCPPAAQADAEGYFPSLLPLPGGVQLLVACALCSPPRLLCPACVPTIPLRMHWPCSCLLALPVEHHLPLIFIHASLYLCPWPPQHPPHFVSPSLISTGQTGTILNRSSCSTSPA